MDIESAISKNVATREMIKEYIENKGVALTVKNIAKGMSIKRKNVKYLLRSDTSLFQCTARSPYSSKKRYVWCTSIHMKHSLHSDTTTDIPSNE